VLKYSGSGDLIADPFCGSGTVALEAILHGRNAVAVDCNEYAVLLTKAKTAKLTEVQAVAALDEALGVAAKRVIDLRRVPVWVRQFFHPRTLKDTIAVAEVLKERGDSLLLACLLGILHHQRPGFLSYPSSHLVPYLRTKNFPRDEYPEMYTYRDVRSRMVKKLARAFARVPENFFQSSIAAVTTQNQDHSDVVIPSEVDAVITSPPYMNALDYVRDNRLRLWLLSGRHQFSHSEESVRSSVGFKHLMVRFLSETSRALRPRGYCVLVVGEATRRSDLLSHPARVVLEEVKRFSLLQVVEVLRDSIPDVRRSRRHCEATKSEVFIVLRKRTIARAPNRLKL
jgi:hypothetical protein